VSAQYADIVLPICTSQELNDINPGYQLSPQMVFMNKCIEPLFESKTDMEACKLVADKLGLGGGFIPDTEDNMLKAVWAGTSAWNGGMTYGEFKAAGVAKYNRWSNPTVFLKNFIANPATGTPKPSVPSGKIEFYSMTIKSLIAEGKISGVDTRPIPSYPPRIEGPGDPIMATYPLADGQPASFKRSHSTFANIPWIKEIGQEEDGIIMHPDDAAARGIETGDRVRVWNDRGEMWLKAFVSNTIAHHGSGELVQGVPARRYRLPFRRRRPERAHLGWQNRFAERGLAQRILRRPGPKTIRRGYSSWPKKGSI